jgi:hypothetical protein
MSVSSRVIRRVIRLKGGVLDRPRIACQSHPKTKDIIRMIRKLKSGEYRLYSRKKNPKTGKRRNLGTFSSLEKARAHERAVQYFKRH